MSSPAEIAAAAALVGDPTRAAMLWALMDGRALSAGELASAAGVTPQTASGHLAQLAEAGFIAVAPMGRRRYHRLASPAVAHLIESLTAFTTPERRPRLVVGPREAALRRLRTCYDHLAGEVAVGIADRMQTRGQLELSHDGAALTPDGEAFVRSLGLDLDASRAARRVFCRPCLDWSERRLHLAGAVGAALCTLSLERGWFRRAASGRALEITPRGVSALHESFDVELG
jgi:DNA-binding transcriptional ArsR family regulator